MFAPEGHEPDRAAVVLTRATLPAVALMLIEPVASGVGSELMPFAFPAPCTRYRCPGASVKSPSAVTCHAPVPVAAAYCKDQPPRETAVAPRLYNST